MHSIFQIGSTASKPVNSAVATPITAPSSVPGTAEPDMAPGNFSGDQTSGVLTQDRAVAPTALAVASTLNPAVRTVRGHSTTTWTEFCHFLPPSPCVDSFYTLSVDKNRYFLIPSPPPQCVELMLRWQFCVHSSMCPEIYL